MQNIKAIVFDYGGVIEDSSFLTYAAFKKGFEDSNQTFSFHKRDVLSLRSLPTYNNSRNLIVALLSLQKSGKKISDVLESDNPERKINQIVETQINNLDEELIKKIRAYYKEMIYSNKGMDNSNVFDGVKEVLEKLSKKYTLAIFTNRESRGLDEKLENYKIRNLFKIIISEEDVKNKKPDPEGLITISKMIGIEPNQIAFVEDSGSGIRCAKDAGSISIGILSGLSTETSMKIYNPDHIVKDFNGLLEVFL